MLPRGPPLPAPGRLAEEQRWDAPGAAWPRGVPSCCCTPVHGGRCPSVLVPVPAQQPAGSAAAYSLPRQRVRELGPRGLGCHPPFLVTSQGAWLGESLAQCSGTLAMCQRPRSQLWPGSGWGGEGFPGTSRVSSTPVPQAPLPKEPGRCRCPSLLGHPGHPPAPSSLPCPLAPRCLAQPLWAQDSAHPVPVSPWPSPTLEPWLPVLETWCRPLPRHVPVLSACLLM